MRLRKVVEIDHIKGGRYTIPALVPKHMVVSDLRKIIEFEIIDEHAKAFFDMLSYNMLNDEPAFTGTGSTNYQQAAERIHYIDKTLPDLSPE
jgi:hypothetical protein